MKKLLVDVEELEPVLIIMPNSAWVNQYCWLAYYTVMDIFATHGLPTPQCRDKNPCCIFHFREYSDLCDIHDGIKNGNLALNAFSVLPSLHASLSALQLEPVGKAWILLKVGSLSSNYGQDCQFFIIH